MTDFRPSDQGWAKADIRLRATLSSWHQSPRYRTEAATRHRSGSVRPSSHSDLNREVRRPNGNGSWFLCSSWSSLIICASVSALTRIKNLYRENLGTAFWRSFCFAVQPSARADERRPDNSIRKSSSFFPDLSCAVSQRGCLPRPAQVSDGRSGFLYFGRTRG